MSFRVCSRLMVFAVLISTACFRYVVQVRPLTDADCTPKPAPTLIHGLVFGRDANIPNVIHGRVVDTGLEGATPAPRAGVEIRLSPIGLSATTDVKGRFTIIGVPPGHYELSTRGIGFRRLADSLEMTQADGIAVEVSLDLLPNDGCPGFMAKVERRRVWRWPWQ